MRILTFLLLSLSVMLSSCMGGTKKEQVNQGDKNTIANATEIQVKYAKGFTVKNTGDYRLVDIQDPLGESAQTYHYALVPRGEKPEGIPQNYTLIEVPVQRVICMTALQMSNFIKLKQTEKIVGISSTRFLFNETIKRQLKENKTSRIGIEGNFDNEVILASNPDIVLVSPFKRGGYESVKSLGFPLVTFLGYKESSPLGQAEWIKFTAMLLGVEEQANHQFDEIEKRYNELKTIATNATSKPTVMSGELHGGNWYIVGGKSYLANLFEDAGARYFMQNDDKSGGFYVDFETVYSQGAYTDFWRVVNSFDGTFSYDAMKQTDARYADFKPYKDKKVIYCNLRQKPFYENTPVEPEVVLADLIKIFHPDLLPDYTPVYYEILK